MVCAVVVVVVVVAAAAVNYTGSLDWDCSVVDTCPGDCRVRLELRCLSVRMVRTDHYSHHTEEESGAGSSTGCRHSHSRAVQPKEGTLAAAAALRESLPPVAVVLPRVVRTTEVSGPLPDYSLRATLKTGCAERLPNLERVDVAVLAASAAM